MSIAWDYLPNDRKAQLLHCRPELRRVFNCVIPDCGGQVMGGQCLLCATEYDGREPIKPLVVNGIKQARGRGVKL